MADLGFMPAVTRLLDETPDGGQRLLFSATLDRGVDKLVERYLADPVVHAVATATASVELMEHRTFTVAREDKIAVAAAIAGRPARTLFFVRTKHGADRLARQLNNAGVGGRDPRQPEPEPATARAGRLLVRPCPCARRDRRRGARHPRRRRRPGRALRPGERPQGLPAPLRPHGPRRRRRHRGAPSPSRLRSATWPRCTSPPRSTHRRWRSTSATPPCWSSPRRARSSCVTEPAPPPLRPSRGPRRGGPSRSRNGSSTQGGDRSGGRRSTGHRGTRSGDTGSRAAHHRDRRQDG